MSSFIFRKGEGEGRAFSHGSFGPGSTAVAMDNAPHRGQTNPGAREFGRGVQALKDVSFELRAGEVHALVGENGAGKSTLIKIMTGALEADSGMLTVFGKQLLRNDPSIARALGIAAIYQQPALFMHLSVAENIAWALETARPWRKIHWKARKRRAMELLQRAGGTIDPDRDAGTLSMPEQQIVEIAKAIGSDARILITDEPTASLTDREVESLFSVFGTLRAQGLGIIFISHRLEEISAIADRVTILRDGETIGTRNAREVRREELIELMVGRPIASVFPKREVALGQIALELRNVSSRAAGVDDVSLSVRCGEILGLAGLVGSGRTQIAETIFGLTPADSGEILVRGKSVRIPSPAKAIQLGIGYLPEDRRKHGVILEMPVAANASLASFVVDTVAPTATLTTPPPAIVASAARRSASFVSSVVQTHRSA